MKMIARIAFAAAVAVAFASSAQAQRQQQQQRQQPGGGGFGAANQPLRILVSTNKALQEELKLKDEQITAIKEYITKNTPARAPGGGGPGGGGAPGGGGPGGAGGFGGGAGGFGGGAGIGGDLDTLENLKAQVKVIEDRIEFYKSTLTKEQYERFTQIETQRLGVRAFTNNARIAKELKITDDQKKRITEINADLQKELTALRPAGGGGRPDAATQAENAKKRTQLSDFALEAIEKELTGDQKTVWAKLTGPKFDLTKLNPAPTTNN